MEWVCSVWCIVWLRGARMRIHNLESGCFYRYFWDDILDGRMCNETLLLLPNVDIIFWFVYHFLAVLSDITGIFLRQLLRS